MTLEAMARIWFNRSPMQQEIIARKIMRLSRNEKCPSARTDTFEIPVKNLVVSIIAHPKETV
jgi:hypothetical protein